MQAERTVNKLIRIAEVMQVTGKARTQLYAAVKTGNFPAPIKDGTASLWVESEVQSWIADRIANAPRKVA